VSRPHSPGSLGLHVDVAVADAAGVCPDHAQGEGRELARLDPLTGLTDLLAMSRELDAAIATAVRALHEFGYSWTEIADRLGTSRQNARQRWGRPERGDVA
jgi:DNA-directed RNA polymerase specialized sigma24 family protein